MDLLINEVDELPIKLDRLPNEGSYGKIYKTTIDNRILLVKQIENRKYYNSEYLVSILIKPHSNLCKCIYKFTTTGYTYLFFNYYKKGDLYSRLEAIKLEEKLVKIYVYQMLNAVKELNNIGYVHCDIKLENFLIDDDNKLVLTDFGSIKPINNIDDKLLTLDSLVGSEGYIPPEVSLLYYNEKTDIWSIGVCFYNMLTGENLYDDIEEYQYNERCRGINKLLIDKSILSYKGQYLLRRMLQASPLRRISTKDALKHSWFDDIRKQEGYTSEIELVL